MRLERRVLRLLSDRGNNSEPQCAVLRDTMERDLVSILTDREINDTYLSERVEMEYTIEVANLL